MAAPAVRLDDQTLPLVIKRSPRAKRMSLRLDLSEDAAVVVLPPSLPESEAVAFAQSQAGWLQRRLAKRPDRVLFQDGAVIPYLGEEVTARHAPQARRGVWKEGDVIWVSGQPEHFARRLTDWLKKEAKATLSARTQDHAQAMGTTVGRISVREVKSRWGSCSAKGDISYSWRLIFAPPWILDYITAHETAHRLEHNHSPRFWAIVAQHNGQADQARAWLQTHGLTLHRYG